MARNSTLYNSNFSTTVNLPFGLCSTVGSASVSYTISSRRIPSSISVQGESPVQNPIIFPNHHGWIVYSLSNPEVLSSILNGGSFLFCLHSKNTERRLTVSATPRRSFTSIRALWRRRRARKEAACEAVEKNQISMEKNQVFYLLYGEQSDLRPFFLPLSFWSPRGSAATSQFSGAPPLVVAGCRPGESLTTWRRRWRCRTSSAWHQATPSFAMRTRW